MIFTIDATYSPIYRERREEVNIFWVPICAKNAPGHLHTIIAHSNLGSMRTLHHQLWSPVSTGITFHKICSRVVLPFSAPHRGIKRISGAICITAARLPDLVETWLSSLTYWISKSGLYYHPFPLYLNSYHLSWLLCPHSSKIHSCMSLQLNLLCDVPLFWHLMFFSSHPRTAFELHAYYNVVEHRDTFF